MFKEYFESYGKVAEAQIMMDQTSGRSRGFGCVQQECCAALHCCQIIASGLLAPLRCAGVGCLPWPETAARRAQQTQRRFARPLLHRSFVTFEEDGIVAKVFEAGSIHELGGKKVEVKSATPKGSGPVGSRLALVAPAGGLGGAAIMGGGASYLTGTGAYVPMAPGHGFGAYSSTPGAMGAQAAAAAAAYGYGMAGPAAGRSP